MLLSMTGFGEARGSGPGVAISIEIRAVNNRYLKVAVRGTEPYPLLESDFEKVVRRLVKRGTLAINVRVEREAKASELRLNASALRAYLQQIEAVCNEIGRPNYAAPMFAGLLALPGIAPDSAQRNAPPDEEWPLVERTLEQALAKFQATRQTEGQAMAEELFALHRTIGTQLVQIREHLPSVQAEYRKRLLDRLRLALAETGVKIEEPNLIRELALFADRSDVGEELVRLAAHLDTFEQVVRHENDAPGRRLEFVLQEMGRETNTLGSKAGDVMISRHAVEIKACLEKIRELVANVE